MDNKEPIVKNAVTCGICQSAADRHDNHFECQANPNHVGDLIVGIFSDLTHPSPRSAIAGTRTPAITIVERGR